MRPVAKQPYISDWIVLLIMKKEKNISLKTIFKNGSCFVVLSLSLSSCTTKLEIGSWFQKEKNGVWGGPKKERKKGQILNLLGLLHDVAGDRVKSFLEGSVKHLSAKPLSQLLHTFCLSLEECASFHTHVYTATWQNKHPIPPVP